MTKRAPYRVIEGSLFSFMILGVHGFLAIMTNMKKLFLVIALFIFTGPTFAFEKLDKKTTVNGLLKKGYTLEHVTTYTDMGIAYTLENQSGDIVTCVIRTVFQGVGTPATRCFRP